jgi:hypothetical protein
MVTRVRCATNAGNARAVPTWVPTWKLPSLATGAGRRAERPSASHPLGPHFTLRLELVNGWPLSRPWLAASAGTVDRSGHGQSDDARTAWRRKSASTLMPMGAFGATME